MYDTLGKKISFDQWVDEFIKYRDKYGFKTAIHFLWWSSSGSNSRIFGVPIYGNTNKDWYFHKIIMPVYKFSQKYNRIKFYLKCRFVKKYQYHIVDTGLEPNYYDVDCLMLHANFVLLTRFIEEEGGEKKFAKNNKYLGNSDNHGQQGNFYNPPDLMTHQFTVQSEALFLYRWWKYTKPKDEKLRDQLLEEIYGSGSFNENIDDDQYHRMRRLEEKIKNEEQEMLIRLIKIRQSLWT